MIKKIISNNSLFRLSLFRLFLLLTLSLLLTGCFGFILKTAYNNGDYFVKNELEKFVSFTDSQDDFVEEGLIKFFEWHRKDELPKLLTLLNLMEERIKAPAITRADVDEVSDIMFEIRDRVVDRFLDDLAEVLTNLDDEQLKELEQAIIKRNLPREGDDGKTFKQRTDKENLEYYLERRSDLLEDWLGDLTEEQIQLLIDFPIFDRRYSELQSESRQNIPFIFIGFLKTKPNEKKIKETLLHWIDKPEVIRTAEYNQAVRIRREKFRDTLVVWHRSLTPDQKESLLVEVSDFKEVVQDLIDD